jgi:hypothetical protein
MDLVGGLDQSLRLVPRAGQGLCAHGLPDKKPRTAVPFKKSPFNVTLAGCPLEERISEFTSCAPKAGRWARWR